jgi:hypothetical protein
MFLILVDDCQTRAVARAIKPGPPPGLNEKKTNPTRPTEAFFLTGAGDGLNPRGRGPTRAVAPSSSHIEKLVILYACGLKILPQMLYDNFVA